MTRRLKTEHAGAKNGGGYWGRRAEAKAVSNVVRRHSDNAAVDEGLAEIESEKTESGFEGAPLKPPASE